VIAFWMIGDKLGGFAEATAKVVQNAPDHVARTKIGHLQFLSYMFVPLSVGMFPHLFQHWLTARSAKTFRLSVVFHPIFIMIVWVPCILIGIWAKGIGIEAPGGNANAVLARTVAQLLHDPVLSGVLTAGILAAIMSSLDSQFVCLGAMFTHDIVLHRFGTEKITDRQQVTLGRAFIVAIVAITYGLTFLPTPNVFNLAVWCFSGFASLFPLVFASLYWRRVTRAGAVASILVMVATWCVFFYDGFFAAILAGEKPVGEYLVFGMMPVAVIFAASAATLVLVSLATSPPPRDVVDKFFMKPAA